jgi:hypothetical protein
MLKQLYLALPHYLSIIHNHFAATANYRGQHGINISLYRLLWEGKSVAELLAMSSSSLTGTTNQSFHLNPHKSLQ